MDNKIILDTNIPVKASTRSDLCPTEELPVQVKCIEFIQDMIKGQTRLVLDMSREIINEYENNVDKTSSMGMLFFKWLYQYLGQIKLNDFLMLEKDAEGEYVTFPLDDTTRDFDPSDRKFIALANAHPEKPPIIEGTDSKWWGYKAAFQKYGIKIHFLDEEYAERMYRKKISNI